ncbi:Transport ATP-binding protein CydD [plant metagenome]|uniref:Transport ATP-binding protein CydD n=1 Tax=plant metagenome TaxID=1297885 RepID=A0A484Q5G2_9ZZZZ
MSLTPAAQPVPADEPAAPLAAAASASSPGRAHARWLAGLARAARRPLMAAVAAPLLAGALLLAQTWFLAQVLHQAIAEGAPVDTLYGSIAVVATLMGARVLLTWLGERAGQRAAESIKLSLRQALFAQLLARGPQWTRGQRSGELASMLAEQVEALDGFFSRYLPAMVAAAFLPLAFALALMPVDWVAGLILLLTAPLIPVFMALVGWGAEAANRRHLQAFARLSSFFADRVRGLATLKLFGRAQAEAQAVRDATEVVRAKTMAVLRIAFLSSAVLEFFAALGVAGVALYVGLSYLGFVDLRVSPLSLQAGLFCLLMAPEVYAPLRQFAAHYHDRATARAAAAQLAATFETLPEPAALAAGQGQETLRAPAAQPASDAAALQVSGLVLRAPGRPLPVIDAAGFSLAPGEHVALAGASGIGKSTLLEALAGLRDGEGTIRLDGRPLADWPRADLRQRVALISQRPYLQAGSIAGNLRLAAPQADAEALHRAAERAGVLRFAQDLPQGLDTELGPRGYGLSGGQAQRVALARLFLRDPGLVLLDEPTARLDGGTRDAVLREILAFCEGRTLLLVTHDEAVLDAFPRVLRIQAGGRVA